MDGALVDVEVIKGAVRLACRAPLTAVALAVLAASTIARVVALALPWLLNRVEEVAGFGSGPLAA